MGEHRKEARGIGSSLREQAMIDALTRIGERHPFTEQVSKVVAAAEAEAELGRSGGTDLLHDAADVDARLWIVRLGLLDDLAAMSRRREDGMPHRPLRYLLAVGDATPAGWARALPEAIVAATEDAPRCEQPARPGGPIAASTLSDALQLFARDPQVHATDLWSVRFPSAEATLALAMPTRAASQRAVGREPDLLCVVQHAGRDRRGVHPMPISPHDWSAFAALIGGLWAAERLALAPERLEIARAALRDGIVGLIGAVGPSPARDAGRRCVEQVAGVLESHVDRSAFRRRTPASAAWRWPSAFALVAGALDRFAGPGSRPVEEPPPAGTLVAVDEPESDRLVPGRVVEATELPRLRSIAARLSRADRDEGPRVPVEVAGDVRLRPLSTLLTPPRAQLFGYLPQRPR